MKLMHRLSLLCMVALCMRSSAVQPGNQELLQQFAKPIIFNRANIQTFLTDVFNHRLYGTYCLPSNFMHIADFLSHTAQVENPRDFSISIFNLFHARLKESFWVNPYACAQILEVIAQQCAPLCEDTTKANSRAAIKKTLYNAMLSRFHELKADPEYFMTNLADEIITIAEQPEKEAICELQHAITRFIESALDKIIWDPREQESCWESCKLIAEQLHTLYQARILRNETALNHCYWSLVYRFCYFLETTGEHISPETYALMKQDLATKNCVFLALEEQEEFILSKSKRLQLAMLDGEVKSRSVQAGIILR
jgi:hypothetical protein